MQIYAWVHEGRVSEFFKTDRDMAELFHPSMVWVDVSSVEDISIGWEAKADEKGVWKFSEPKSTPIPPDRLAEGIRNLRDNMLSKTDYIMMPDYPTEDVPFTDVLAYRKLLRDITTQEGFPIAVDWPKNPIIKEN